MGLYTAWNGPFALDWTELFSFSDKFLHLFFRSLNFPGSYQATMDDYSDDNSCLLQCFHIYIFI